MEVANTKVWTFQLSEVSRYPWSQLQWPTTRHGSRATKQPPLVAWDKVTSTGRVGQSNLHWSRGTKLWHTPRAWCQRHVTMEYFDFGGRTSGGGKSLSYPSRLRSLWRVRVLAARGWTKMSSEVGLFSWFKQAIERTFIWVTFTLRIRTYGSVEHLYGLLKHINY